MRTYENRFVHKNAYERSKMERLFLVSLRVLIIRVLIINSFDDSFYVTWNVNVTHPR